MNALLGNNNKQSHGSGGSGNLVGQLAGSLLGGGKQSHGSSGHGSGSGSGGASTPIKKEGARTPTTAEPDDAGMVKWGEWKEDKGVQMRDWVQVLERDGRERKALQKAMNAMK